ncbi:hypothetical protein AZ66_24740 [Paenibacillus sp. E194]|uniref:hypothetical protein n=1 Tax=Paenibacillus sp. E194 TaxID=1458845 RepID=UPI0005C9D164|nr:hypothetical protein [Paenibacillus sp. E194]KJB85416.1 hypothetical protein AZ66_24740 [Paenibacillus sp. E194]
MTRPYREAWMIVKNDLVRFKWGLLMTVMFSIYMATMSGLLLRELFRDVEPLTRTFKGVADFVFLATIPNLGFYFSRRSMRYMKDDSYTKWMRKLRIFPIDARTVVLSRTMQMCVAMLINMSIIIVGHYMLSETIRSLDGLSILSYVFMLAAYAVAVNWLYISFELSVSGRLYMRYSLVLLGVITMVSVLIATANGSMLQTVIDVARSYPWMCIVLSIVIIVNSMVIGMNRLRNIVLKRDWM